jgi:hypothetical protein
MEMEMKMMRTVRGVLWATAESRTDRIICSEF